MRSAYRAGIATASSEKRTHDAEQKPTSRTNGRTGEFHSFGFRVSASSSTDIGSAWGRRSKMDALPDQQLIGRKERAMGGGSGIRADVDASRVSKRKEEKGGSTEASWEVGEGRSVKGGVEGREE
jgi:hypothetical protein